MHWMTEGDWFNISYDNLASHFSFGIADARRQRHHIQNPLEEEEMKFMYAPGVEGNAGTTNGLYIFYSVLNRLFRKIVCPRDIDPTNISQFAKNLLANMRDGASPLSVMDFVWEEIKDISLNPQKICGFAPFLMFIIEDVTRSFPKDGKHMPFSPSPTKKPLIPPAQVSPPPRPDPTPQQQPAVEELIRSADNTSQTGRDEHGHSSGQQREKSSSPLKKMFGLLYDMCRSHHVIETRLHEERKARKKL
jgi:hypothetical protein